jgi:SAM-dependent methyltransferase
MNTPPILTDQTALARNRQRARSLASGPALFLHEALLNEIEERLAEVNKVFTAPAIVTGWPEVWTAALPGATTCIDAETLSLEPVAHDLVLDTLTLHWANDPVGRLVQARRALRPDGLMIAALFGGRTLHELRASLAEAEARVSGGLSPRVAPMAEIRDLGGLLQRAGFALPVADSMTLTVSYESPWHLMRDLRAMGETNALANRLRHPTGRAVLNEAARIYAESFPHGDDRVAATFEIILLTGWAPDESQQKPLRPGSAAQRLADALGAAETPLPDDPV